MNDTYRFISLLKEGALYYGINLNDDTVESFLLYFKLLSQKNSVVNLLSKRDMSRFVEYHLLDSLKVASLFDFSCVRTMIDFGSGAGLPGIPLSLAFPDISATLLDSRAKKCSFLSEICKTIPLLKTHIIHTRIESLADKYNGTFDVVITRATVSLMDFYLKASRFIRSGGSLISIKGKQIESEISELQNVLDDTLFSITIKTPKRFHDVRQGTVTIIERL